MGGSRRCATSWFGGGYNWGLPTERLQTQTKATRVPHPSANQPEPAETLVPRILIVRMSSLGDILMALPTAVALRRAFPSAYLGWVVDEPFAALMSRVKEIDEVFVSPIPNGGKSRWTDLPRVPAILTEFRALSRTLRQRRFDVVLEMQALLRSGVTAYFSRAPERIGFADVRREMSFLFVNRRVCPNGRHDVDRYLTMAEVLGAPRSRAIWPELTWPEDEAVADTLLQTVPTGHPLIALNPGASASYRRWPAERFVQAAARIHQRHAVGFVVVGSTAESGLCQRVCDQASVPITNLAGRTSLPQLAAVLRRCTCMLTADTGPMHLAVAVGTRVVALMGPTDPALTGPYGSQHVLLDAGAGRRPTGRWGQHTCHDPALLRRVTAREAAGAVCAVLANEGRTERGARR